MKTIFLLFGFIFHPINAQFNKSGVQGILDAHNEFRSSIAKGTYVAKGILKAPGKNMLKMKWNSTVATSAQNYANTCPSDHLKPNIYGENMWGLIFFNAPKDVNHLGYNASKLWGTEFNVRGWNSDVMTMELFHTGVGHSIQMAWSGVGDVGCGVKVCGWDKEYDVKIVCHYWGTGVYLDSLIYESGPTCSACPANTTCDQATGLCDSNEPDIPEPLYKYDELVNRDSGYKTILGFSLMTIVQLIFKM